MNLPAREGSSWRGTNETLGFTDLGMGVRFGRRKLAMTEHYTIKSTCGAYTRDLWVLQGPGDQPHHLTVFLDGEFYLEKMNAAGILQDAIVGGAIPPMTCLFVSHRGNVERHQDLVCNPRYSRFIAEDVVAWARQRNSHILGGGNMMCGVSLSGLAAAHITLLYPTLFSHALCQSGSFWWLADNALDMPTTDAAFWLSVGSEETATEVTHPPSGMYQRVSQIEGVKTAACRLEKLGGRVKYRVFQGGHAFEPWSEELVPALTWLSAGPPS